MKSSFVFMHVIDVEAQRPKLIEAELESKIGVIASFWKNPPPCSCVSSVITDSMDMHGGGIEVGEIQVDVERVVRIVIKSSCDKECEGRGIAASTKQVCPLFLWI